LRVEGEGRGLFPWDYGPNPAALKVLSRKPTAKTKGGDELRKRNDFTVGRSLSNPGKER